MDIQGGLARSANYGGRTLILVKSHGRHAGKHVEIIYYTLAGIILYFVADWVLSQIESYRGARASRSAK